MEKDERIDETCYRYVCVKLSINNNNDRPHNFVINLYANLEIVFIYTYHYV